jgi:hypothetical protein
MIDKIVPSSATALGGMADGASDAGNAYTGLAALPATGRVRKIICRFLR